MHTGGYVPVYEAYRDGLLFARNMKKDFYNLFFQDNVRDIGYVNGMTKPGRIVLLIQISKIKNKGR